MLELLGVEVLALEFVEEDGRVTTRVTVVVVLEGLLFCVAVVAVEVRAGAVAVVVVVGLLFVAGLAVAAGVAVVVTRLGSCLLLLLLLLVTGSAVVGRSCLLVTIEGSVFPVAGRVVGVVLPVFPLELPDTE